jgi:hypothetical protein
VVLISEIKLKEKKVFCAYFSTGKEEEERKLLLPEPKQSIKAS